jgi:low temperature requirement protein LtrA
VGDEFVLAHPLGHSQAHMTAAILGGPAIFLFGSSLAAYCVWGRWAVDRLAACSVLVLLMVAALAGLAPLSSLWLSLMSTAVLLGVVAWEARRG